MNQVAETPRAIEAVWRIEQAKLVAGLTRMVRDISTAEELAQDALIIALDTWPKSGVPRSPGAWLMAAAKRKAIDYFRRRKMIDRKLEEVGRDLEDEEQTVPDYDTALDDDLHKNVASFCAYRAANPDFPDSFRNACQHDISNSNAPDDQADAGDQSTG